jgi:23S rRNA-/tRNA-specific pseudouridylate synthase
VRSPPPQERRGAAEPAPGDALRVLYDEGGVVAVDKPPGLETSGRSLDDPRSVQFRLAQQLRRPVWAAHQLDRDTSGVLVFTRRASLVAELQARMKPPRGRKRYLALVHGEPRWTELRIDAPLRYDERARRWAVHPRGKPAQSLARLVAAHEGHALVELELLTGRTHQARLHLAHVGHPLVGEARYLTPPCRLHLRHALHAAQLELDGLPTLLAPLADDLAVLAASLGLAPPLDLKRARR